MAAAPPTGAPCRLDAAAGACCSCSSWGQPEVANAASGATVLHTLRKQSACIRLCMPPSKARSMRGRWMAAAAALPPLETHRPVDFCRLAGSKQRQRVCPALGRAVPVAPRILAPLQLIRLHHTLYLAPKKVALTVIWKWVARLR